LKRLLLIVAFLLVAASAAWGYSFSECGTGFCHWTNYPVAFFIQQPLGIDIDEEAAVEEIVASFARWDFEHQTFCRPLEFTYGGRVETETPNALDQKNVVSFATEKWTYGPEVLAVTTCWYNDEGQFFECDIAFNAKDFTWSTDGAPGTYEIRQTLVHEVGHFWGLGHSSVRSATMYAYYIDSSSPADLDEDDIRAAAVSFCDEELPSDDVEEPNDSHDYAKVLNNRFELTDLRLYDDDWWQLDLPEGNRLKVTVTDQDAERFKYLELYENGEMVDQQRCDGDCAQALGQAGAARSVVLRVHGDYDNHAVQAEQYDLLLEPVLPGQEGQLTDDDNGDEPVGDDDDDDGCGCGVSAGATPSLVALLPVILFVLYTWVLRGKRRNAG